VTVLGLKPVKIVRDHRLSKLNQNIIISMQGAFMSKQEVLCDEIIDNFALLKGVDLFVNLYILLLSTYDKDKNKILFYTFIIG